MVAEEASDAAAKENLLFRQTEVHVAPLSPFLAPAGQPLRAATMRLPIYRVAIYAIYSFIQSIN